MYAHGHENAEPAEGRAAGLREARLDPLLLRAAAAGRTDVLGTRGLLAVQRAVGNDGAARLVEDAPVADLSTSSGTALGDDVRQDMEARLGADFSDVRVHTGDAAHAAATSVDALAYTSGSDIVFQSGRYDPSSSAGQTMLAHELTHVVQQRNGPVDGTDNGSGLSVSSPSDRFEREAVATADRVMSQPAPTTPVQRQEGSEADDDLDVQTFVQRNACGNGDHADHDH